MADHMATLQAAADRIKSEQRALEGINGLVVFTSLSVFSPNYIFSLLYAIKILKKLKSQLFFGTIHLITVALQLHIL